MKKISSFIITLALIIALTGTSNTVFAEETTKANENSTVTQTTAAEKTTEKQTEKETEKATASSEDKPTGAEEKTTAASDEKSTAAVEDETKKGLTGMAVSAGDAAPGKTVTVSVTVTGNDISNVKCAVTYDEAFLDFVSVSGATGTDGKSFTLDKVNGTKTFTVSYKVKDNATNDIKVSASAVYDGHTETNSDTIVIKKETATTATTAANNNYDESYVAPGDISSDSMLNSLSVKGYKLTPSFSSEVLRYTLTVPTNVKSIDITAKAEDKKATVSVVGGKNLVEGENTVKIICTSEAGFTSTYVITVTREKDGDDTNDDVDDTTTSDTVTKTNTKEAGVPMWVLFLMCVIFMGIGFGLSYIIFVGFEKSENNKTKVNKKTKYDSETDIDDIDEL